MAGKKSDFTLPTNTLDELFSTQEERDDAKLSKIRDIPLELIDDFPDHPFKVRDDEDKVHPRSRYRSKEAGAVQEGTPRGCPHPDGQYAEDGSRYECAEQTCRILRPRLPVATL